MKKQSRQLAVTRTTHRLLPDPHRVIAKPHLPGEEIYNPDGKSRVKAVMERILAIPDSEVARILDNVAGDFAHRHRDYTQVLHRSFQTVAQHLEQGVTLTEERRLLIGAYFTREYSFEAAALFNPSIVPAPDQSGLASGQRRFIMSVRAVGEGHISSVGFRSGVIDERGDLTFDPVSRYAMTGRRKTPLYDKHLFSSKLEELGAATQITSLVLDPLPDQFSFDELEHRLALIDLKRVPPIMAHETIKIIHLLASSNYVVMYPHESEVAERVIYPTSPRETQGMEDARFVRFVHDDGSVVYYATYTAFDGVEILPQLIETEDFVSFRIATLNGACAQNKGMALFPRLIDGKYTMLSRFDGENAHMMRSDNVRFWGDTQMLRAPMRPWELIQIGNCGSPIETEAGWLVLTHGVGPMRRYAIGALLLDLDDTSLIIAHLPDPLMVPEEDEREGYVPNVLYSCGAMVHRDHLILPYGFSDVGIRIARVCLPDLLDLLREHRCDS
ncbi:MAG: glycoside hydrolase family 130 protein [Planctomycetota bacterium]|jgi:predicted GH43/DUF377 family glycosyl hydrolase